MDLLPVISTAILVATIASIVIAIVSYAAYKTRERRRPIRRAGRGAAEAVVFFHRYAGEKRGG
jgi:biopolymer transport protein ExbB/TolQ